MVTGLLLGYALHVLPPLPMLQLHLLFFRFGFLGTCSQGFLQYREAVRVNLGPSWAQVLTW